MSAQIDSAPTARSIASSDKRAAARQALAQPDDAREGVDDGEAAVGRARDQQPAIVGAEVDRAISVTVRLPPRRGALIRRPALLAKPLLQSRRTGDTLRHDTPVSFLHRPKTGRLTWSGFNHNFMALGKSAGAFGGGVDSVSDRFLSRRFPSCPVV